MGVDVEGGRGSVCMINNLGLFLNQVRAGLGLQGVGGGMGGHSRACGHLWALVTLLTMGTRSQ